MGKETSPPGARSGGGLLRPGSGQAVCGPQLPRPSKQPQGRRGAAAGGRELELGVTEGWGGSWKLRGDQGWFRDPGSETVDSAAGLSSQGGGAEKTILGP